MNEQLPTSSYTSHPLQGNGVGNEANRPSSYRSSMLLPELPSFPSDRSSVPVNAMRFGLPAQPSPSNPTEGPQSTETAVSANAIVSSTIASHPRGLANPGTLGHFSFASTTLVLSLYNTHANHITTPNAIVSMALFVGGLAQLLAGMWEFPRGNTFAASAFSTYGAFWMSFATLLIPGSGIVSSYQSVSEFNHALGIYLIVWFIVTFLFFIATLRKSVAHTALFGSVFLTFIILAASAFGGHASVQKAGGVVGCIAALVAFYVGLSELLDAERQPIIRLPLGVFPIKKA